jgi:Ca2+-binding EF-hand superfamily protein
MLCGTDPLPELFRAKRYKIHQKFLTKTEFQFIMRNLPVEVGEDDIDDMFKTADTDGDGKIGYKVEFFCIRYLTKST